LVQLGLVGLLAASAFEIHTHGEHWPFSSYPMFSKTRREARVLHHALVAVPRDGSAVFPLYKSAQIHPFHWYRHQKAFKAMLERHGGETAVRKGLADGLERYERARRDGRHDGPPLQALRLYRVDYELDPDAPDLIRHEERTLVAEVLSAHGERTNDR
jgi:hypothetical protein